MSLSVIGVLFLLAAARAADDSGLMTECSTDFQSVMTCLSFAQGKQTQSGAQNLKSLGVQEAKLFELPSACQLKNASVSDCPKILGLSPNSPDAAIFTNSSSKATATPSTPATSTGTPSSAAEKTDNKSSGTKLGSHFAGSTAALLVATAAVFLFAFPA
ncbi:hypothetical protein V6N13_080838 [Hibiscus sabdariffa]|uniref:Uncharacterized protein n=2 Tax=Hibiscus sabdariffa TaxID=183260 RepID=A0ABR2NS96_9ROSI